MWSSKIFRLFNSVLLKKMADLESKLQGHYGLLRSLPSPNPILTRLHLHISRNFPPGISSPTIFLPYSLIQLCHFGSRSPQQTTQVMWELFGICFDLEWFLSFWFCTRVPSWESGKQPSGCVWKVLSKWHVIFIIHLKAINYLWDFQCPSRVLFWQQCSTIYLHDNFEHLHNRAQI